MARDVTIQVRMTEDEAVRLHTIGERLSKSTSGLRKLDGAVNLSAVIRHLIRNA